MPYKSPRHCAVPGCPGYAENGVYCKAHIRDYNKSIRDPALKKHYGRHWEKIRALFLSKHPLCEACKKAGLLTPATEVHHIKPVAGGGTDEDENLMALCKPCHSRFTMEEVRGRGVD